MRLYNPKNGAEFTTASDDELHVAVYLEAGWEPAPEPVARPGYQPESVRYAPVVEDLEVVGETGEYDGMTKDELQAELRDRKLSISGTKDELIARLQEDDAAEVEPSE